MEKKKSDRWIQDQCEEESVWVYDRESVSSNTTEVTHCCMIRPYQKMKGDSYVQETGKELVLFTLGCCGLK